MIVRKGWEGPCPVTFAGKTPVSRGTGTLRLVAPPAELEVAVVGKPPTTLIPPLNALGGPSDGCKEGSRRQ
jgi:hypothetical protein